MIKLFATVLAMSDTGSVSISSTTTDFPNMQSCEMTVERIFHAPKQTAQFNGHTVTINIAAECVPLYPQPRAAQ